MFRHLLLFQVLPHLLKGRLLIKVLDVHPRGDIHFIRTLQSCCSFRCATLSQLAEEDVGESHERTRKYRHCAGVKLAAACTSWTVDRAVTLAGMFSEGRGMEGENPTELVCCSSVDAKLDYKAEICCLLSLHRGHVRPHRSKLDLSGNKIILGFPTITKRNKPIVGQLILNILGWGWC